ncbi:helix-turn-helix domain-containing protein [Micromonospora sp. CA-259024]|uniref:helix-turn-helix domain-containing protein n=1 Tax=Micromonospora sp. CA-259024 TaxID=3239965 RepID=UPI003D943A27
MARLILYEGWSVAAAARRYEVPWRTANRWAQRYRQQGTEGMQDPLSRPHRSLARTPRPLIRETVHLRSVRADPGSEGVTVQVSVRWPALATNGSAELSAGGCDGRGCQTRAARRHAAANRRAMWAR